MLVSVFGGTKVTARMTQCAPREDTIVLSSTESAFGQVRVLNGIVLVVADEEIEKRLDLDKQSNMPLNDNVEVTGSVVWIRTAALLTDTANAITTLRFFDHPFVTAHCICVVLASLQYCNVSSDPTVGVRIIRIEASNDRGVESVAEIDLEVYAEDDPTQWSVPLSTVVYRCPVAYDKGLASQVALQKHIKPCVLRFAESIQVIDDDTTFFSGGYFEAQLNSCERGTQATNHPATVDTVSEDGLMLPVPLSKNAAGLSYDGCVSDVEEQSTEGPRTLLHDGHPFGMVHFGKVCGRSFTGHLLTDRVRVEFASGGSATMDAVEELLSVIAYTRKELECPSELGLTRFVKVTLLVGVTTGKKDVCGQDLPPSSTNQPLTTTLGILVRPSLFCTHEKDLVPLKYVENSGRMLLAPSIEEMAHGLYGGFLRLDLVEGADDDDELLLAGDDSDLIVSELVGEAPHRALAFSTREASIVGKRRCGRTQSNLAKAIAHGEGRQVAEHKKPDVEEAKIRRESVRESLRESFATIPFSTFLSDEAQMNRTSQSRVASFKRHLSTRESNAMRNSSITTNEQPENKSFPDSPITPPAVERKGTLAKISCGVPLRRIKTALRTRKIHMRRGDCFSELSYRASHQLTEDRNRQLMEMGLDPLFFSEDVRVSAVACGGVRVATAFVHPEGSFALAFQQGSFLDVATLTRILRHLCFRSVNRNPCLLEKTVLVSLSAPGLGTSSTVRRLLVEPVDDPTEIAVGARELKWRIGATEREIPPRAQVQPARKAKKGSSMAGCDLAAAARDFKPIGALRLFPVESTTISDPDTDTWDGGFVLLKCTSGGTSGDVLQLLTVKQQMAVAALVTQDKAQDSNDSSKRRFVECYSPPNSSPNLELSPKLLRALGSANCSFESLGAMRLVDETGEVVMDELGWVHSCKYLEQAAAVSDPLLSPAHAAPPKNPAAQRKMSLSIKSLGSGIEDVVRADLPDLHPFNGCLIVSLTPRDWDQRIVKRDVLCRIVDAISFRSDDILSSRGMQKHFELAICDCDNETPGIGEMAVNFLPPLFYVVPEVHPDGSSGTPGCTPLHHVIQYPLRQASDVKCDPLLPNLATSMMEKERFTGVIEIYFARTYNSKDVLSLFIRDGSPFTLTSDGLVICNKELVCRSLLSPSYIKLDCTRECRGAVGKRLTLLLQMVAFSIDVKDAKDRESVVAGDRTVCVVANEGERDTFGRPHIFTLEVTVHVGKDE